MPEATMPLDQGFDDGVVEFRSDLLDRLISAVRPAAVRQQGDGELAVGIDPQRGARVAQVAERARTEMFSGLRGRGRSIPAEGAGCAGRGGFAAGKQRDGFGTEDGLSS